MTHWPYCRVTVRRDPHTSKVICIDLVFDELAAAFFVNVDAPCLTMMDFTTNHCWIGVRLHLKAGYTVSMDVAALKVTLQNEQRNTKLLFVLLQYQTEKPCVINPSHLDNNYY